MIKPPAETAAIETVHLQEYHEVSAQNPLQAMWSRLAQKCAAALRPKITELAPINSSPALVPTAGSFFGTSGFSLFSAPLLVGTAAAVIPLLFLVLSQPNTPTLRSALNEPTREYVASRTTATTDPIPEVASDTHQAQTAELASTQTDSLTSAEKSYHYQLTLADGYLRKAISLSKEGQDRAQTESEKQAILTHIDQAMQAANRAIELVPDKGDAFLLRANIYQVSSVIRPELAELATQDRTIAEALGVSTNSASNNPIEYLPTEQAASQTGAIIADPESKNNGVIGIETESNQTSGTGIIPAGTTKITVSYTDLLPQAQLAVTNSTDSTPVYVQTRSTGVGFTIALQKASPQDITVEWTATVY